VYTLEGVTNADGSLRQMSIAQLCMAICLQRASRLETKIIALMNALAANSENLQFLSDIESAAVASTTVSMTEANWNKLVGLVPNIKTNGSASWSGGKMVVNDLDQFCTDIESGMDSLNSLSQETLIEIESLTAKRDDTYTLVSNVTKSCYQTLSGIVANV